MKSRRKGPWPWMGLRAAGTTLAVAGWCGLVARRLECTSYFAAMVLGSAVAPKFQGHALKITTVKPWTRACFAQSPSNSLQFLISDGRRASLMLPTGKVLRDLHGLEACRDKIVRVSASHDGSCVVALTSDGHCWLHNCALGQSEAIDLPAADSLPLEFNLKAKKQQLWDVQLEACASTSLISFSWMGPAGNMMMCLPFAVASTASHASRTVVWANHEEQFFPGVTILGSCVCSAAMLSLEGWVTITSSLAAGAGADSSGDSWTLSLSCSLFCIKEGTTEPTGSVIADFVCPSPFTDVERDELSKRTPSLHSSRRKPAIFAVHGGEGLIALIINCSSPCLYFFNIDSSEDAAHHPKICLPLDSAAGAVQEFVCDAAWVCQGWWLVLLLSTGRLCVFDRRGVLLTWAIETVPGAIASGSGTKIISSIQMPSETLALREAEWTVTAHPFQPCVSVCTGFFILVVLLPLPHQFVSSILTAIEQPQPSPEWVVEYAKASQLSSQPGSALDTILILSHVWCLVLSNPVALEGSKSTSVCSALSNGLVSAIATGKKPSRQVFLDCLRAFLIAGSQATYLCPISAVNRSHQLDLACIHVIVSGLVSANSPMDAAALLCACRKRCDVSQHLMLRSQYLSCIASILNIWKEISAKELQDTVISEIAALNEILAADNISIASIGSHLPDRKVEAIIARALGPTATVLESAVCFCQAGQSVAALAALINGGYLAAVVSATLRMQGVLTGSSCTVILSAAVNGKCWNVPLADMAPNRGVFECEEDATLDQCVAFILKSSPQTAVHSVVRFAAAVGALAVCDNSNPELHCLQPSQCIDTQSEFTTCPVLLRVNLSSDPSILLGNDFEQEECQPVSVRAVAKAFKDVLTESCDHVYRECAPPSGVELAWVLCLLAGCGAEAALVAAASVEIPNAFASLSSLCDKASAAATVTRSSPFATRVSNFQSSVCDWITDNINSLSSFLLSPANIELLQFSSGLPAANLPSHISMTENIVRICSEAVGTELLNLCRHIAGDQNVVLNSNIKDACIFLAARSREVPEVPIPINSQLMFLWAVVDRRRPTLKSLSGSISLQLCAAALTKAQLLLEFSLAANSESSFLNLSATFCVGSIETALRSGISSAISREHIVANVTLLCLAVRKGAIPEQRHKLRAIAQSILSMSAHANSMINSLFESEQSDAHSAEFEAAERELMLWYESVADTRSSIDDHGLIAELKTSAESVLGSLSEEIWICHSALIVSSWLGWNVSKTIEPVVFVPQLLASVTSSRTKPSADAVFSDPSSPQSLLPSVNHASESARDISPSAMRSLSPKKQQQPQAASQRALSTSATGDISVGHKVLSPREPPPRILLNTPIQLPFDLPEEPLPPISIARDQLSCPSRTLDAHESAVNAIVVSVEGSWLFTAGDDCSIKKWQLDSYFCVKSVLLDQAVLCLAISSDDNYIFSGGNEIVVWSRDLRRVHTLLKGSARPIMSLAITNDLTLHATTCEDVIKKFDPMNDDLTLWSSTDVPIFGSQSQPAPPCAHPLTLSRSSHHLFVGKNDEYILRSQFLPHSFSLTNYVLALAISLDEKVLASGGVQLSTFRADTGELLRAFDWNARWITCVALSHTAQLLFSAGNDGKLHVWDCTSGACISSIQAHSAAISAMALSQDQQWIYTASKDCSVNEWRVASLPGMQGVKIEPFNSTAPLPQEIMQPLDSDDREAAAVVITEESAGKSKSAHSPAISITAASESQHVEPFLPSAAGVSTSKLVEPLVQIAVAPSMSDVLSGMRSDASLSDASDDDFDANFSRISSAIERLQGNVQQHASAIANQNADSDYRSVMFGPDSESSLRALQLAERVGRPQRLHILSKAQSTLLQQQVKATPPLPPAHIVLDLGNVSVTSDEASSPAFTSPARSPAVTKPSPSVVYGSMYMPVTSPQASPRQPLSRVSIPSAAIPSAVSPRSSQAFSPQELRARARRQQEQPNGKSSSARVSVSRHAAMNSAKGSSAASAFNSNRLPVRLLRVSSPASASQVAAAAGAPLLLPLPVQSKAERLSAVAPSLASKHPIDVRILAPRPSVPLPANDHPPGPSVSVVNSGMLVISPDELQYLVHNAVSSAMSASVKPAPPSDVPAFDEAQPAALLQTAVLRSPPPAEDGVPKVLSLRKDASSPGSNGGAVPLQLSPPAPALLRESRSAIVQTDGEEIPRQAPSPLAQSTRQAINDAYNMSLPPSRHIHVVSVAPGAPAAAVHMNSAGSMAARSVAVMRGQPPVVTEDTLSPGKVSRMLLSGHRDGYSGSAATLNRKSLSRQFATEPDPVQLVSASLSAFERKLVMLEQQAAQVEVKLGISGQHHAHGVRGVLDSINSRLGAVLDSDLEPEPPLQPKVL